MSLYPAEKQNGNRISRLKRAVFDSDPAICTERAVIWTDYFRDKKNRKKSPHVAIAEALGEVLKKKSIAIHPDELIVGNFSSKRVGGNLLPELSGVVMLEDIYKFPKRQTNPLAISKDERRRLFKIVPFWLFRFVAIRAYRSPVKKARLIVNQLRQIFYLINESGGISHIAPDYEKLIKIGTDGIKAEAERFQRGVGKNTESYFFYEGVKIICDALGDFGRRYGELAGRMAKGETDKARKKELEKISEVCMNVPRRGARSFYEALQSAFFAQIALNLESLDNSVCPGRMDRYLYPYYKKDIEKGVLTREGAKELVSAFSVKMSEIVPVFSARITRFHGGMFNGQVVTVGGTNPDGSDSTNELSYIFLEVMDELRMRQPNYHARISSKSPKEYKDKIFEILAGGSNSPSLYNDDIIVETMRKNGYKIEDARDYTGVGCVEPVCQGKSFSSTDAALFNVPIILELALNSGRRFGSPLRSGAKTKPASKMKSMEDVRDAFETQLRYKLSQLIGDLKAIEIANRIYHPTPLTSMLIDGCIESGICSTAGGARYNFSGVQCVGPADTGDSLYAIEKSVFIDKKMSLAELVASLKGDLKDEKARAYLKNLPKFGNDIEEADIWTAYVVKLFKKILSEDENTRGGRYVPGLYSVTCHQYFGEVTGALPSGRIKGEPFASGIAPSNGVDKKGPTALINSVNRIDFTEIGNGINLNMKFDQKTVSGENGKKRLGAIIETYFGGGGMQLQTNVLDRDTLLRARKNKNEYPYLLVRVSGYSAYFHDLSPRMQDDIIARTCLLS